MCALQVTQDAALDSLEAVVNAISKDSLSGYISSVRKWVQALITDPNTGRPYLASLPAFSRPKSVSPLWPMLQHGLLYGSTEERMHAAKALGELVALTQPEALKPFTGKFTGPLIRIVGDRFSPSVKTAILETLR